MPEAKTPKPGSRESVMKKPSGGSRRRTSHQKADKKKGKLDDDGTQVEQPWRERPKAKERKTPSRMDKTVEAPAYDDKLKEFAMSCIERGPTEIVSEFAKVKMETQPPPVKTAFDANAAKNRYKDVFCTETSRVVLKDAFVPSSGDYIHANWVKVRGEERFICTQGPLDATIDDFWRLVWQEKCTAVVMLCDVIEGGKLKCAQYWPLEIGKTMTTHSGFTLKNEDAKDVEKTDAQTLRKTTLTMTLGSESTTVTHWHWQHWPDRGVPSNYLLTMRLLLKIKQDKKVVVHCSAGIGRTGTVVGLEMADKVLKAGEDLSMEAVLRDLRSYRHGSVQTDVQYVYMHRVLVNLAANKKVISEQDAERFYAPYNEFMKSRGL